jgi:BlaR1 peptidase M56
METLLFYLIRSTAISGLLLGFYWIALRNRKAHGYNRVFLLMTLAASLVLPLVRLPWLKWQAPGRPLSGWVVAGGAHAGGGAELPVMTIVFMTAGVVSLLLLGVLLFRVMLLYRLRRRHVGMPVEGCYLIEVEDRRAPFSFLSNLFWQAGAAMEDPVHRKIFDHELAHIRGRHTYDNLFSQALAAVCWMNPFYWLIRRELIMVHEFIADAASVPDGDGEAFARMLLQAYDDGRYLDPTHRFFHSPIKRRLVMLKSNSRPSRFVKAMALPVLLAVMALACSKDQGTPAAKDQILQMKFSSFKLNLLKDSVKLRFAEGAIKQVYFVAQKGGKDSFRIDLKEERSTIVPDGGRMVNVQFMPKTGQDNEVLAPPQIEPDKQ